MPRATEAEDQNTELHLQYESDAPGVVNSDLKFGIFEGRKLKIGKRREKKQLSHSSPSFYYKVFLILSMTSSTLDSSI